jgi:hypothetical protein
MALALLLVLRGGVARAADFEFRAGVLGTVVAHSKITLRRDDRLAEVVFRDSSSRELLTLRFLQHGPGEVSYQQYKGQSLPDPTIFVASSFARADGVNVDLVAVGTIQHELKKLFAFTDRDLSVGVCVNQTNEPNPANVLVAEFVEGEYGFMTWPKRFGVSIFTWDGMQLHRGSTLLTKNLHPGWESALQELRLPCGKEVLRSTVVPQE